jgi:hypothetical protein
MQAVTKKPLSGTVEVRAMSEADLRDADHVMRVAFGTFLGLPEPASFMGDASYVANRFRSDPKSAFTAVLGGKVDVLRRVRDDRGRGGQGSSPTTRGCVTPPQHEARDASLHDRQAFELVATNVLVLGQHDPSALPGLYEPLLVGRVLRKAIVVGDGLLVRGAKHLDDHRAAESGPRST